METTTKIKSYLEKTFHCPVKIEEFQDEGKVSLYLRDRFAIKVMKLLGLEFLLLLARSSEYKFTDIRHALATVPRQTLLRLIFVLPSISVYARTTMIEKGIAFVVPDQHIYLPFLAVALSEQKQRQRPHTTHLGFTTQALLLTVLYKDLRRLSVGEAASLMNVSAMTASRLYDEIEGLFPDLILREGRTRLFIQTGDRAQFLDRIMEVLRSPVSKEYRLAQIPDGSYRLGGLSALSHYSMLAEGEPPVLVADKSFDPNLFAPIPREEEPAALVQILRYELDWDDPVAVDPITAILSIPASLRSDPRIEKAIEEVKVALY